eukprot:TRINITY_DN2721_c0_g1_i3.p1 TRINITY_DN2721_c0_g1~~TRINITY_DN2721_c0_g1_i3.p1  ORF type:complete len:230 (-),score=-15.32 TRINITY_DN2721_c0_g1_i3:330-1019(-)
MQLKNFIFLNYVRNIIVNICLFNIYCCDIIVHIYFCSYLDSMWNDFERASILYSVQYILLIYTINIIIMQTSEILDSISIRAYNRRRICIHVQCTFVGYIYQIHIQRLISFLAISYYNIVSSSNIHAYIARIVDSQMGQIRWGQQQCQDISGHWGSYYVVKNMQAQLGIRVSVWVQVRAHVCAAGIHYREIQCFCTCVYACVCTCAYVREVVNRYDLMRVGCDKGSVVI